MIRAADIQIGTCVVLFAGPTEDGDHAGVVTKIDDYIFVQLAKSGKTVGIQPTHIREITSGKRERLYTADDLDLATLAVARYHQAAVVFNRVTTDRNTAWALEEAASQVLDTEQQLGVVLVNPEQLHHYRRAAAVIINSIPQKGN